MVLQYNDYKSPQKKPTEGNFDERRDAGPSLIIIITEWVQQPHQLLWKGDIGKGSSYRYFIFILFFCLPLVIRQPSAS